MRLSQCSDSERCPYITPRHRCLNVGSQERVAYWPSVQKKKERVALQVPEVHHATQCTRDASTELIV